ncbi:TPA: chromosome segregation protein SMC [Streptococcus suis]
MYLARVEMTGFKSFADKTVIEFDQGLTAVVGPNGSGKSNLSEAIRWVLGEQSVKSLRGSKMEDVIFNGTQDRKAVNLAKVTLVLNNEDRYLDYDFSEISITRSYNRNGESSYYINNETVRLKDIVDLLMDSGLGKNSFAMISQGKVESIFLSKPEERRAIFEEAAGVQKYQYRKQEAERKLNKSKDHLSRVRDIIHELSGQLKPLKRQRDKALSYQDLSGQLADLEVSYAAYKIESDRDKWAKAKDSLSEVQSQIEETNQALQDKTKRHSDFQVTYDQVLSKIDEETEKIHELAQSLEQRKGQKLMKEQELAYSQSSAKDRQTYYQEQLVDLENHKQKLGQIESKVASLKIDIQDRQDQLVSKEKERLIYQGMTEEAIETLRNDLIADYQAEAKAKNQGHNLESQIQQAQAKLEQIKRQMTTDQSDTSGPQADLRRARAELSDLNQAENKAKEDLAQAIEAWRQHQEKKEQLQRQVFDSDRSINQAKARLQSLIQMQDQYEGYYSGVKAVMTASDRLKGIVGPVADLIQVAPQYQTAIDTALGASMQHVVVDSDQAAKEAISFLKTHRAGRATFLPLPHMKGRYLSADQLTKAQNAPGFVAIASQLVQVQAAYTTLNDQLLGNTIVMDQVDQAQQLAKTLKHQVKLVTLDGEVLMPGGSITGGRQKHQTSSMLSRQTEINQLQSQVHEMEEQRVGLQNQWDQLQQAETKLQQVGEQAREGLQALQVQLQSAKSHLQLLERQAQVAQQNQELLSAEIHQLETTIEKGQKDLASNQAMLDQLAQQILEGNRILEQAQADQSQRQTNLQALEEVISQLKTQLALDRQQLKQEQASHLMTQEAIDRLQEAVDNFEYHQTATSESIADLTQAIDLLKTSIERDSQTLSQERHQLELLKDQRHQTQVMMRQIESENQTLQDHLKHYFQEEAKLQSLVDRLAESIDSQLEYLASTYQLTFEAAQANAKAIDNLSAVGQEVNRLKKQIEALGPINIEAIEAYEELDQRYGHLVEQETDLLEAMALLQTTMDEMDAEVIKRFSESFTAINHQFQKTFKSLFGGGQAALELTDPANLLTTGVDIIAQPPGKRKQNLALLSGGERAFTAIALLFAILETKPVPFCILDEVEAALDDANVWRYGEYLHHFTQSTQFIVITHRKGTMEHADVLYGVTMEKSGVSKLASVRLSEAPLS